MCPVLPIFQLSIPHHAAILLLRHRLEAPGVRLCYHDFPVTLYPRCVLYEDMYPSTGYVEDQRTIFVSIRRASTIAFALCTVLGRGTRHVGMKSQALAISCVLLCIFRLVQARATSPRAALCIAARRQRVLLARAEGAEVVPIEKSGRDFKAVKDIDEIMTI